MCKLLHYLAVVCLETFSFLSVVYTLFAVESFCMAHCALELARDPAPQKSPL